MSEEILIKAEHVSKKFCRSLKRSLWYGVKDVAHSLMPWSRSGGGQHELPADLPPLRKDEFWALRDVSFELRRGECLGLIGQNGAGKSTLLKILNSLNRPDTGRVKMKGRIGALIDLQAGFNPILTGRENIYTQAALFGFSKTEMDRNFDEIVDFAEVGDFIDMPVQNYSSGMRVRLGFSVAAQMEPDVFLVDEVLAVGDLAFRIKCLNRMAALMDRCGFIFVSHSMSQIHRVCTQVIVMENGAAVFKGNSVSDGVHRYFSSLSNAPYSTSGSGEILVERLDASTQGKRTDLGGTVHIDQGSSLQFKLRLRSKLDRFRLGMVVWNGDLYPIADLVQVDGKGHLFDLGGREQAAIAVGVDALNLGAGRYTLSLHLIDPESARVYCRIDNALTLVVKGCVVGGGGNLIPSTLQGIKPSEFER